MNNQFDLIQINIGEFCIVQWMFEVVEFVWSEAVWRIEAPRPPLDFCGYYHLAPILVSAGWCEARLTAPQ